MQKSIDPPRLFPWYVHILGGWSVGGLFPWYLTIRQFQKRGRKKTAFLLLILNLIVFISISAMGLLSHLPWNTLSLAVLGWSVLWSFGAWAAQFSAFGKAPKRYYLKEWKSWIPPIITAVLLGVGVSVALSVVPLIVERLQMYQSRDLLSKQVILWDFFRYIPLSLLISLPLGLWWAGERDRFSPSCILTYLFGLPFFYVVFSSFSALFFFLLSHGGGSLTGSTWSVISPHLEGIKKVLVALASHDYSTFFLAPLLLGNALRIRDFWRKALVIFPLLSISFLFYFGYSYHFWQFYQGRVLYELSSGKLEERKRAYSQAKLILDRFPEHQAWPEIALKLANHYYFLQDTDTAKYMYKAVYERTKNSLRWTQQAELSAAALNSVNFADQTIFFRLHLPSIRYEPYMTNNWMALIRLMRFYEEDDAPESQTLIRLKSISTSEEEIKLSPMPTLAELDDNATNLGFNVLYLPSDIGVIQKLIRSGYPVIQPIKHSFNILIGLDEGRSVIESISYEDILQVAEETEKEELAEASLRYQSEEREEGLQSRIDILARKEIPYTFWHSPRRQDMASQIAVVFPENKRKSIFSLLNNNEEEVTRSSDSYLSSLIGFNALKSGDVVQAIKWSYQSYVLEKNPFSLQVAHLAYLLWQTRYQRIESNLKVEKQLPQLTQVEDFLTKDEVVKFLTTSSTGFYGDLDANKLSWMIRNQYKDFLDRSNDTERQQLLTIAESNVYFEPESRKQWLFLAGVHEWGDDKGQIRESYEGALKAGQWDDAIALKIAYLHIQADDFNQAKELLEKISLSKVKFNPDYYYCKATLAQWQQDDQEAKKYFEKAIKMRRFDPNYHLAYADFLSDRKTSPERVEKLRAWANRFTMDDTK